MTTTPVSAVLEADVRSFVRRNGIVFWLDLDGHYTRFVDGLATAARNGDLPYAVRAFRGSHLELMFALEHVGNRADKVPLLVHLPGFTEETVRTTPMLELYAAGTRYRKALDTLVGEAGAGRVRPEAIAAFRARGNLTLEGADAWLSAQIEHPSGGFAGQLHALKPMAILEDLLSGGFVSEHAALSEGREALWSRLGVLLGVPAAWRATTLPDAEPRPADIAYAAASWALCVEYVDDLKRQPVSPHLGGVRALPRGVVDACREVAGGLRQRHRSFYGRTADETEALLADEVAVAKAEDLGEIDTFRFEEAKVLSAALEALRDTAWESAAAWAGPRAAGGSFWLTEEPARQSAWQLVQAAARLGNAIRMARDSLPDTITLDGAVDVYLERGAGVDQAHRHLEQRRVALLYPLLPEFEVVRTRLDQMRAEWRRWADLWAIELNAICLRQGFLPSPGLQQRTLFDDVVRPMVQEGGTTVYFVVDAFRFEMGEELFRALEGTQATTVQLRARLAELPTVTEVGMNVLAPVAVNGRLQPAFSGEKLLGFQAGEFRVSDPESRRRAMHDRTGGATCPWLTLDEVVTRESASLKRTVAQARLMVVHSQEIDAAGENGVGPAVFDHVMQKLRAAWRLLRDAGVRKFVFTADHGFLLLDQTTALAQSHGRKIDPKRRHVFSTIAADHRGEARVALGALGYDAVGGGAGIVGTPGHVMFPETTAVFDTGKRAMDFVHGGNSLQERVIPVLTVVHRGGVGGSSLQYRVVAEALDGVGGMHCLEVKLDVAGQGALDYGGAREVELALRTPELADGQVELCQTRGKARIAGGAVLATVGERFELFFRLAGGSDIRTRVELYHGGAQVDLMPCIPAARFAVTVVRAQGTSEARPPVATQGPPRDWLDAFPEGGVRQLFAHLAAHGAVTEEEAARMLGGPRPLRRFAGEFETLAREAPFRVRIDVVEGVKRYVREGKTS